ncbi:hypothetical protein [Amycolatopsis sp. WGS_07]|uniref:hypothetical protein n=1 Tax=Amycolatopsis sp. WGS_07 TaxID=3076764 RepID=UPI003872C381
MTRSAQGRRHLAPAALALLFALTACGGRFSDTHRPDTGPVSEKAAALAKQYRLGPHGFGKIKLGMSAAEATATGQIRVNDLASLSGCTIGTETGKSPDGAVSISASLGVVKIASYTGVRTPEGIALGASVDDLRKAYPDVKVETEADMGNGQIQMDDHYRAPVPGNPQAVYRFFVNRDDRVDAMLLALNKPDPDCDVGYSN